MKLRHYLNLSAGTSLRDESRVLQPARGSAILFMPKKQKKQKLGIDTVRGKRAEQQGRKAIKAFCAAHASLDCVFTDGNEPAVVDGFAFANRDKRLAAIFEVKSRKITHRELREKYDNLWMVSSHKIEHGKLLSEMLCAPFVGLLRLNPDRKVLVVKITDHKGRIVADITTAEMVTTASVNGGRTVSNCSFINMEHAKEYKL